MTIKHIKFLERNGVKVKRIRTDGGKEYNKARRYAEEEGVLWVSTQAYAPDMNGDSQNVGKFLMNRTRAILHDAGLLWWGGYVTPH